MASYHLTAKAGQRGKASAHSAYISREGKYSAKERYEDLEATEHGNMPEWAAHNTAHFWSAADQYERANGTAYREIEVALPRELTPAERLELVREFVRQELGDRHAYQFAIHTPKAALEKGEQPHAHIMFSERLLDGIERDPEQYFKRYNSKNPERGGCKKSSGGKLEEERKAELLALRERWATLQNAHLEKHGHESRVDHRSLKDQGIDRAPEKHLGALGVRQTNKADINALLNLRAANSEYQQAKAEVISLLDYKKSKAKIDSEEKIVRLSTLNTQQRQEINEFVMAAFKESQKSQESNRPLSLAEKEKLAQETLERLIDQVHHTWRKEEAARLQEEARKYEEEHRRLLTQEPKKPRLFGLAQWKSEHWSWKCELDGLEAKAAYRREKAKEALAGESPQEQFQGLWDKAQERLKQEHPEQFQILTELRERQSQERMQQAREQLRKKKELRQQGKGSKR